MDNKQENLTPPMPWEAQIYLAVYCLIVLGISGYLIIWQGWPVKPSWGSALLLTGAAAAAGAILENTYNLLSHSSVQFHRRRIGMYFLLPVFAAAAAIVTYFALHTGAWLSGGVWEVKALGREGAGTKVSCLILGFVIGYGWRKTLPNLPDDLRARVKLPGRKT
jgi:hypothetical protein